MVTNTNTEGDKYKYCIHSTCGTTMVSSLTDPWKLCWPEITDLVNTDFRMYVNVSIKEATMKTMIIDQEVNMS